MAELLNTEDAYRWSMSRIARCFRVSRDTVSRRIKARGIQPVGERLGYPVFDLADVAELIDDHPELSGDPEQMPPRERRDWYEGERVRLEVQELKGELVRIDQYRAEMARILKSLADTLETLPDELERQAGLTPHQAERLISVLDAERSRLADRLSTQDPSQ